MRKVLISSLVLASAINVSPVQSHTRLPYDKAPSDDTVVQCGALFALVADGYEDAGETSKSRTYKEKFAKQLHTSENEFLTVGRPKREALQLYDQRRGELAAMAAKDTKLMVRLVRFCNQKYPL